MCRETEPGLEPLRMAMSGPSTVALKLFHKLLADLVMRIVADAHWYLNTSGLCVTAQRGVGHYL